MRISSVRLLINRSNSREPRNTGKIAAGSGYSVYAQSRKQIWRLIFALFGAVFILKSPFLTISSALCPSEGKSRLNTAGL